VERVSFTDTYGIAVLAVDRPPANALDLELLRDLVAAVQRVEVDPPRALV